ncbi:hypothetical protein EON81_10355 [bacterium]|nr:MAG: hypothetical protein EON81_10355 [bacterium]
MRFLPAKSPKSPPASPTAAASSTRTDRPRGRDSNPDRFLSGHNSPMTPLLALVALAPATTDLVFVRHSETVANATGKYNSRTLNVFSVKGQKLVDTLTEQLVKAQRFDAIVVSPSPRALRTIAPYLARTGQKATVWPLLYECCTERPRQPEAKSFGFGATIKVPSDLNAESFTIIPTENRLPAPRGYGEGLAQVRASVAEFRQRFAGKRVLVVGHSAHGGLFLKALTGKAYRVENAKPMGFKLDLDALPPQG